MTNLCSIFRQSFAAATLLAFPLFAKAQTTTYSGEAAAARADVLGLINVSLSDTGALPSSGGSLSASLLQFQLQPTLDLNLLSAATSGGNNQTASQASVTNVSINVAGVHVTASVLASNATVTCDASGNPSASGSANIVDLKVNGLRVDVSSEPNFTVPLLVGSLVINQQSSSVDPVAGTANMLVNALHLRVNGVADVVISSSAAGISCGGNGGGPISPE